MFRDKFSRFSVPIFLNPNLYSTQCYSIPSRIYPCSKKHLTSTFKVGKTFHSSRTFSTSPSTVIPSSTHSSEMIWSNKNFKKTLMNNKQHNDSKSNLIISNFNRVLSKKFSYSRLDQQREPSLTPHETCSNLPMTQILSIETSCDDTAVAILQQDGISKLSPKILFEKVITHHELVEHFGGVHPTEMANMHKKTLDGMIEQALNFVKCENENVKIDAIAVTIGPGLPPCLSVGVETATIWSQKMNIPCIPIHHLEAHLLMPLMFSNTDIQFPYLALLASGGHCMIVFSKGIGDYEIIGSTEDDSIGEAFDKTARLLKESVHGDLTDYALNILKNSTSCYEQSGTLMNNVSSGHVPNKTHLSGGALIEILAMKGQADKYRFAIPLRKGKRHEEITFSFSGLKTEVLKVVRSEQNNGVSKRELHRMLSKLRNTTVSDVGNEANASSTKISMETACDIAASMQQAAFTHLMEKLQLAIFRYRSYTNEYPNTLIVSGGVSANEYFRKQLIELTEKNEYSLKIAPLKYCTDNAVMIGFAALKRLANKCHEPCGTFDKEKYLPRWTITSLDQFYKRH
ncbi:hypothetical protein C9374_008934 [Naegleria lovaniensis]|uniref:N(6)-L-threonylcarbamoyladenine synthase n=1 Tax=Naegleria lovaniensis TaxID=51637 RepID=A0AA88KKI7_NAELO|nr:uncharacterized protein C9374_008934 [Naegleria lovaniensis]KAG2377849.1 hypothetical protein C9374_008934 [Naegleria lovaniensis]